MEKEIEHKIGQAISQIKPFPHVVQEAISVINSGDSDHIQLANIIKQDLILSARILSLANSPFYGMSREIIGIENACIVLGENIVRNILISAGAIECFPAIGVRKKIWIHCIQVANISQLLALKFNESPDDAYMSGLLHDVGKFVLLDLFPEYQAMYDSAYVINSRQSIEEETKKIKINHAQVGANVIEIWNLPEDIRILVENHHAPVNANDSVLCHILSLSDVICHKLESEISDRKLLDSLIDSGLKYLNSDEQYFKEILPGIREKISSLDGILEQLK